MRLMASPRTCSSLFTVFFFQRHLRGDSGLKFGVETASLRQKLGFLLQKGQYLRFKLL